MEGDKHYVSSMSARVTLLDWSACGGVPQWQSLLEGGAALLIQNGYPPEKVGILKGDLRR
ncbi:MAG: hypothetical protein C4337_03520 [Armatimonadota bacterium]